MKNQSLKAILLALALGLLACNGLAKPLKDYVPVLPETLSKALPVDPKKGYLVKEVARDVYLVTDGIWQSAFVVTGKGVVLLDAPQSLGRHLVAAVKQVTDEPIRQLVYSHSHVDHIGGAPELAAIKDLKIVASEEVATFLREKNDPRRPLPTKTFRGNHTLKLGSAEIKLNRHGNYHSNEADLFIYIPDKKFLMVIDSIAPGYVPFMDLDLSSNVHEYLAMFDRILSYRFDVFVGGHLGHHGQRSDVVATKEYVFDVYQTVKRIHQQADQMKIMASVAEQVGGWDNKYLLFKVFLDTVIERCAVEIEQRWIKKLSGVDVWANSHCRALLIYVRWDD